MNTEVIIHSLSVPTDKRFFLDFRAYKVDFLPDMDSLGSFPIGEGRELIWRGVFVAIEVPAKQTHEN